MGRTDYDSLWSVSSPQFRVLEAIEKGMRNHELVATSLAVSIAGLHHGGVAKLLVDLCRQKLLSYERGKRYDGYRLTDKGYDYLALNELRKRGIYCSVVQKIGTGKESHVYAMDDPDGEEFCLKIHRLGRTCFRNVKNKRDYHRRGRPNSWLYLAKISAAKEFAYMKALHDRKLPVPKPIHINRHCIVMELVDGLQLNHVREVENVGELYDELMQIIVQLGEQGVIHCDFNEFNIMLTPDEHPIIIDFPQMISTDHPNAETFFERDVNCVREFFKKRFSFESESYPEFSELERCDNIDVEVRCSGYTKRRLQEDGEGSSDELSDEEENENNELTEKGSDEEEIEGGNADNGEGSSAELSNEEENEDNEGSEEEKIEGGNIDNSSEEDHIHENKPSSSGSALEKIAEATDEIAKAFSVEDTTETEKLKAYENNIDLIFSKIKFGGERVTEDNKVDCDKSSEADERKFGGGSVRSSATTIPPDEIRRRVRKEQRYKETKERCKRCVAKGEASRVTRTRKENKTIIKESRGIWGWE